MNKQQRKVLDAQQDTLALVAGSLENLDYEEGMEHVLKTLSDNISDIEQVRVDVEELKDEEQDKYDNMPEGLQGSDRGEAMQTAIEELESADTCLQDVISALEEVKVGVPQEDREASVNTAIEGLDEARNHIDDAINA